MNSPLEEIAASLQRINMAYANAVEVGLEPKDLLTIQTKRLNKVQEGARLLFHGVSGYADRVRTLASRIACAADGGPVMITGESGTGKEVVAKIIALATGAKVIAVNCASIPESLFESEFFGHAKGSFTGALSDRPGYLELCSTGILFLDELGEMPLHQQARLLRVLQERTYYPVGHSTATPKFFLGRVVAATNRPIDRVSEFIRLDLYERIAQYELKLEPLRLHTEDLLPLTSREFLAAIPTTVRLSGNVRQLLRLFNRWKNLGPEFLTAEDFN